MTERKIPETHVGKDYVVIINNNEAYKIAKEYDEDEIKQEIEYMNQARNNGIPVPKVVEVTDRGMIMEMAKGNRALDVWKKKFDLNKKKTFVLSLANIIKKLPKKGNLYLFHPDLDLQNIFANDDGEITDIIDWRDCEYLPEIYIRKLPAFLIGGNYDTSESDTEILSDIFYEEVGKLSETQNLIICLHRESGCVELRLLKDIAEGFNTEMEIVTD